MHVDRGKRHFGFTSRVLGKQLTASLGLILVGEDRGLAGGGLKLFKAASVKLKFSACR